MAQETIQYDINVNTGNSVKTLGQLEEELAQINEELQDVDRNSQAFEDLAKRSQDTTRELEKVNNQIEGIRGEDKIQALDGSLKVLGGTVQDVVGGLSSRGEHACASAGLVDRALVSLWVVEVLVFFSFEPLVLVPGLDLLLSALMH